MSPILSVFFLSVCLVSSLEIVAQESEDKIKTPKEFFGFQPGDDRMLFDCDKLIEYLQQVADKSPRVEMIEIGESPMGEKMYLTFFSAEQNIVNLDRLKAINKDLALNDKLDDEQLKSYTFEGKVFILGILSMRSTEVGPSQAAPLLAYDIATTSDPELLGW